MTGSCVWWRARWAISRPWCGRRESFAISPSLTRTGWNSRFGESCLYQLVVFCGVLLYLVLVNFVLLRIDRSCQRMRSPWWLDTPLHLTFLPHRELSKVSAKSPTPFPPKTFDCLVGWHLVKLKADKRYRIVGCADRAWRLMRIVSSGQ